MEYWAQGVGHPHSDRSVTFRITKQTISKSIQKASPKLKIEVKQDKTDHIVR